MGVHTNSNNRLVWRVTWCRVYVSKSQGRAVPTKVHRPKPLFPDCGACFDRIADGVARSVSAACVHMQTDMSTWERYPRLPESQPRWEIAFCCGSAIVCLFVSSRENRRSPWE